MRLHRYDGKTASGSYERHSIKISRVCSIKAAAAYYIDKRIIIEILSGYHRIHPVTIIVPVVQKDIVLSAAINAEPIGA